MRNDEVMNSLSIHLASLMKLEEQWKVYLLERLYLFLASWCEIPCWNRGESTFIDFQ